VGESKCIMVLNISKTILAIYNYVTFIQLGANIYDNPSYLKIMKHISNTRVIRRLRKVAKSDCYLYRIRLSVRKLHIFLHWTNLLDILYWGGGGVVEMSPGKSKFG
jgi:hypothetical protein